MAPALAFALLAPLALHAADLVRSTDEPDPTGTSTGATSSGTDPTTGTTAADGATGTDTATMPPVYEPCGCRNAGEGGLSALLVLLALARLPARRR